MIKLSIAILLSIFFCEASFPAVSVQLNSQIKCYLEKKPALRPQSDGFSLENAHTLAVLSLISYAQPKMAMASALQIEGLTKAKWITSRKSDTQAMWLEGTEVLALIFRGTEVHSRLDIQTDLMALSEGLGPIGKVHVGFNHAFNSVWKTVLSNFNEIKQIKPLLITGHSLGAALATLAATQLLRDQTNFQAAEEQNNEWNKPFVQGLYTYGSPRVGDRDFAIRFDYLVQKSRMYTLPGLSDKPKTYSARLVNGNDAVPRIPGGMSYTHIGELKYFDSTGKLHEGKDAEALFTSSLFFLPIEDWDWIGNHNIRAYAELTYIALHGAASGCFSLTQ